MAGVGSRYAFAVPRESEYVLKDKAKRSGYFPEVNEPLSNKLQNVLSAFQSNAQLMAMLERRRALEQQAQYEMQARESMQIIYENVMPALRPGLAPAAAAAAAGLQAAGQSPRGRRPIKGKQPVHDPSPARSDTSTAAPSTNAATLAPYASSSSRPAPQATLHGSLASGGFVRTKSLSRQRMIHPGTGEPQQGGPGLQPYRDAGAGPRTPPQFMG